MRLSCCAALLLCLGVPASAGRDEGDARLTVESPARREAAPAPPPAAPAPAPPAAPAKRQRAPRWEEDESFKRELLTLRARAWFTIGSVDTRISKVIDQDILIGETEERGSNGLMMVYSAELAPIRWLSGEFQYGEDTHKGSYSDRYWVHSPQSSLLIDTANGATWRYPDHEADLAFAADARSRRDWVAGTIYARIIDLRPWRVDDPVWHETLDVAAGYERFRQYSNLTHLSVTVNQGKYFSPALSPGPIAGFDSGYSAVWSGPHIGFRNEIAVPGGFSFDSLFLWSPFMSYRGEGYDNMGGMYWYPLRDSGPNYVDTAKGTAVHFQLGLRWDWRMLRVEAGYQRFYFYSRTGSRTFSAADGSIPNMQLDFATAEIAGAYAGASVRF
ncbi:MAG: hypothetical protein PHU21_13555 [Elusimicrobia bacterium]|nr:hypothetical protein [Elusimicrobiota bacterium]